MLSYSAEPKQSQPNRVNAVGTLALLAVAQASLILGAPGPVLAQPAISKPPTKTEFAPLSSETKAAVSKAITMVNLMNLIGTPIQLKVTNATLEEITAGINETLPERVTIEVRKVNPARFTLELKEMPAGQVLHAAATLTGSKVYVLSDRLLIAQENQLSDTERKEGKEWSKSLEAGGSGWSAIHEGKHRLLATASASFQGWAKSKSTNTSAGPVPEQATKAIKMSLGDLSPELQGIMQHLVIWERKRNGLVANAPLSDDTSITFDDSKLDSHSLSIKSQSQGNELVIVYRSNLRNQ